MEFQATEPNDWDGSDDDDDDDGQAEEEEGGGSGSGGRDGHGIDWCEIHSQVVSKKPVAAGEGNNSSSKSGSQSLEWP